MPVKLYNTRSSSWIKHIYKDAVWEIPSRVPVAYLTFDDGPTPEITSWVLETLKKFNAKAVFFCVGQQIQQNPDLHLLITENGHIAANHTFNHLNGWLTPTGKYVENVQLCNQFVSTPLFRPPYGKMTAEQYKILRKRYQIMMWSVLSGDFDIHLEPDLCYKKTINAVKPGSIIAFHDSVKAFPRLQYVLPRLLETLSNQGYLFLLPELSLDNNS